MEIEKVATLGQVFTPPLIADEMISLVQNSGRTLEPSCGDGAFIKKMKNVTGIELDEEVGARVPGAIIADFFSYSLDEKFDTIIGNPPYVQYRSIHPETQKLLKMSVLDKNSNLYMFFMDKCIRHLNDGGEMIFITPRDFIKASGAKRLNRILYDAGSFTYFRETGDDQIFKGYSPNCAIWRWVKGETDRMTAQGKIFNYNAGQIYFSDDDNLINKTVGSYFRVKVGAVSGADDVFEHPEGNVEMVCSKTGQHGITRRVIYGVNHPSLITSKERLLQRKTRKFTEKNWWQWGRSYFESDAPRIYVNCKTRNKRPFFTHPSKAYDGSVLALFPKDKSMNLDAAVKNLNDVDWKERGFQVGGRFIFTQKSLKNIPVDLQMGE